MGKVKSKKRLGTSFGDDVLSSKPPPLASQIIRDSFAAPTGRAAAGQQSMLDDQPEKYLDKTMSAKILKAARQQREELEKELGATTSAGKSSAVDLKSLRNQLKDADSSGDEDSADERTESRLVGFPALGATAQEEHNDPSSYDDEYDVPVEISADEESCFAQFCSSDISKRRTLGDIIADRVTEKQTELSTKLSEFGGGGVQMCELDPMLVDMYKGVRDVLATYRSGKLPKAFKILPKLTNWEQILHITEPDKWTAAAMFQATRIFASNMNPRMCQRFYSLVLLPRIRDDIAEFKKLNFQLYQALRKSLYKPAAFFKGILLPLCESGTCTLREATIIGSIVTKSSVPMLHTAAAMLKISEMDYCGANSLFLRVLIDKKYTLPYRVIDGLVDHFLRFASDKRELPVLWHQALLALAQRYKHDVSTEQREALLELIKIHSHGQMTSEIRRELSHATPRDAETNGEPGERADVVMSCDNPDML